MARSEKDAQRTTKICVIYIYSKLFCERSKQVISYSKSSLCHFPVVISNILTVLEVNLPFTLFLTLQLYYSRWHLALNTWNWALEAIDATDPLVAPGASRWGRWKKVCRKEKEGQKKFITPERSQENLLIYFFNQKWQLNLKLPFYSNNFLCINKTYKNNNLIYTLYIYYFIFLLLNAFTGKCPYRMQRSKKKKSNRG